MRKSTIHKYEIHSSGNTRIRENTLYFPGWNVLVDGKSVNIEFQDPKNRGLITFFVPDGKHSIDVKFQETRLRLFANFITILSIGCLLFYSKLIKRLI